MSRIDFRGQGAGIGKKLGGDANSVTDYVLTCGCGAELGPLGRFSADGEGRRCAACPKCHYATVVDKEGRVVKFLALADALSASGMVNP